MLLSKTRWVVQDKNENIVNELANKLDVTPLVATLLVNRGIKTADKARFFLFDEGAQFHDPFLMNDMEKAVERIMQAISEGEKILIYGDYDADGVSSTAMLMITLRDLGAQVDYYIPNRFTDGYGLNSAALKNAAQKGVSLIITVDTGISSISEITLANELAIDVIITDHHEPQEQLPAAFAIVHPKVGNGQYPFDKLAGAGVAFKLAHSLYGSFPEHILDLAAIGTIADLVSLTGENRLIAKRGLEVLANTDRVGLQALCKVASLQLTNLDEETISFGIGPRLNAVGRLSQADKAVELLLTDNIDKAEQLAEEINQINIDRQALVREITEAAIQKAEEQLADGKKVLVIANEQWHEGVIGIVASRLVEKFHRPVLVFSIDKTSQIAKGSCRSIPKFDMFKNLATLSSLLVKFGGHPMAAGLSINLKQLPKFTEAINELAKKQLVVDDFIKETKIDAIVDLENVTLQLIEQINLLAPFGIDNEKPKVLIEKAKVASIRQIGALKNHLKLTLGDNDNLLDVVGFNKGQYFEEISPHATLSVAGELSINEWNNLKTPQLFIDDLAVDHWQLFDMRGEQPGALNKLVPERERIWIVFREETISKLNIAPEETVYYVTSPDVAKEIDLKGNVVFADLPPTMQLFNDVIENKSYSRIYTYFYKKDSTYFATKPTREHFKWFYRFLHSRQTFNLKKYSSKLAEHQGWSKDTIDFMAQVFLELEFVTISEGIITIVNGATKRDLAESSTYRQNQQQFKVEKELLYSSYKELKKLFTSKKVIEDNCKEVAAQWI